MTVVPMPTVNMLDAKTHLSKLVEAIETGAEPEVIIARNGRPVARLVPIAATSGPRIVVARGAFVVPDRIDADNEDVAKLFGLGGS